MRWRKRHAWGAVLVALFLLPIVRPQGFEFLERPTGAFFHWFAGVPVTNPPLAMRPQVPGQVPTPTTLRQKDTEHLRNWQRLFRAKDQLKQARALARAFGEERLRDLPRMALCRVLRSKDPVRYRRSLLIDKGAKDGLEIGQPVIVDGVFAGRVAMAYGHTALVRLVTDPQSRIEVLLRTTTGRWTPGFARRRGVHEGSDVLGVDLVRLRPGDGQLAVGTPVVTSSADERVPSNLLVGSILDHADPDRDGMPTVRVTPSFEAGACTEVVVLLTRSAAVARKPAETK